MLRPEILVSGILEGHRDSIYAFADAGGEGRFFSSGGDGQIVLWDLAHPQEGELIARLPMAVYSLLHLPAQNLLLAGCRYGSVYVLDLVEKKQKTIIELQGDVFDLKYIPSQNTIAAACAGGYVNILDAHSLSVIKNMHPADAHCRTLAINAGATRLATGWSDGRVRLYDTHGYEETAAFEANQPSVFALHYLADGRLLSGGRDALLRVWDGGTLPVQQQQHISAHMYTINHILPLSELGMLATAARDKTVKLWDAQTLELLKVIDRPKLPAHTHSVNRLHWLPGKNILVSGGDDKVIRLWGIIC